MKDNKFKWTVEIEINKTWIGDGFEIKEDNLHSAINELIPYAYTDEIKVKILKSPDSKAILTAQGY